MNLARIDAIVARHGLEPYRAKQLRQAFFREHAPNFGAITTLAKAVREQLDAAEPVLTGTPETLLAAADGQAFKALLRFADGGAVETVLMSPKPGLWSVCISTQTGCALGCRFCATGALGAGRNLTSEEITDQVLFWLRHMAANHFEARLSNVVYMGMGEPFRNTENVFASLTELTAPDAFGLGARHLSISTAGLVDGIRAMAERFPQVNLAVSLHAANDELRSRLMPVNRANPLGELAVALTDYLAATNRKVFIEYLLLGGVNDSPAHAAELAKYLRTITPSRLLHVNLIAYNAAAGDFRAPSGQVVHNFLKSLTGHRVSATIRKSLGQDIRAACGQLAGAPGTKPR